MPSPWNSETTKSKMERPIYSYICNNNSGPDDSHIYKMRCTCSKFASFTLNSMFTFTSMYVCLAKYFEMCSQFKFVLMIFWKVQHYLNLTEVLLQHMVFFKLRYKCSWNICSCGLIFTLIWYFLNMLFSGDSIHSPGFGYKEWLHGA